MVVGRAERVRETVERLLAADARGLAGLDTVALRKLSAQSTEMQSWLAAFDVQLATAAAAIDVAAGRPANAEPVVSGGGRKSHREAAAAVERARACNTLPGAAEALAAGELATAHVDALAAVTKGMSAGATARFASHAGELLDNGRFETPEEFARRCKRLAADVIDEAERLARHERCRAQRKVTRWSDSDGMCHTKLSLDPLTDAQIWAAIEASLASARNADQAGDDRSFDHLRADVLVDLIARTGTDGHGDGALGGVGAEVSVVIDLDSLLGRAREAGLGIAETSNGQPLPVATIRRLCCDGRVLPVVLDGDGLPIDVGRAQRLATRARRQALRVLYATCGVPGCTVGFDRCRIHHVAFWDGGHGPTDLDNLFPACERHHHMIHEGGWTLTMTTDRIITWRSPDGTIVFHGDSRNRVTTATTIAGAASGATVRAGTDTVNVGLDGDSNEHARRIVNEVIPRRQRTARSSDTNAATARQYHHHTAEPPALFGTVDATQHRGPPQAS